MEHIYIGIYYWKSAPSNQFIYTGQTSWNDYLMTGWRGILFRDTEHTWTCIHSISQQCSKFLTSHLCTMCTYCVIRKHGYWFITSALSFISQLIRLRCPVTNSMWFCFLFKLSIKNICSTFNNTMYLIF